MTDIARVFGTPTGCVGRRNYVLVRGLVDAHMPHRGVYGYVLHVGEQKVRVQLPKSLELGEVVEVERSDLEWRSAGDMPDARLRELLLQIPAEPYHG